MKLLFLLIIFSFFVSGCGKINTEAQIRASNTGKVGNADITQPARKTFDFSTVDFKNFTFPDFGPGNNTQTITLKNGAAENKDGFPKYILRKTYYFDVTGDRQDEAISHIIAEGCQMGCDSSNLFYIHTAENNKPKLLWKIANGGNVFGGLKAANFKANEIVMEVFGDCILENLVIKPNVDLRNNTKLKTNNFTRFVFTRDETGFTLTSRELVPVPAHINMGVYRTQINFGDQL